MRNPQTSALKRLLTACAATALMLSGCSDIREAKEVLQQTPVIFPDYTDVTLPPNIAPTNFQVEGAGHIQAQFHAEGMESFTVTGKEGIVDIPLDDWKRLLAQAQGKSIRVEVSVWNGQYPQGVKYQPFEMNVATEVMDPWIAYRLIEPGYQGWRQLGIYQRDISCFDEVDIITNKGSKSACINCHHFPNYSAQKMMFHARGDNGGTILYTDGRTHKVNIDKIGPKKGAAYPSWHPEGRLIAFSSNTTRQTFFGQGQQPIEVYDKGSDLIIYDTEANEVITDPRFMTQEVMETYPHWSPDGKTLYYVASDFKNLPVEREEVHYHLMRIPFDAKTRTFGEQADTLYNAHTQGGSVSYPRVSPDGRYMLYTHSSYGTFPIWHPEADLQMLDLQTLQPVDIRIWNDKEQADSYHAWSSNGRWVMYGSRRLDGRYTRLYMAYWDPQGKPHKPFLLPQKDPRHNTWRLKSYNVPEFILDRVELPEGTDELFECEDKLL